MVIMWDMGKRDSFGQRVARLREAAGLTQASLADKAGLPLGTLRNLEQGRRTDPRLSTLNAIANALKVSLDTFRGIFLPNDAD